jgi:hypothetical protein
MLEQSTKRVYFRHGIIVDMQLVEALPPIIQNRPQSESHEMEETSEYEVAE